MFILSNSYSVNGHRPFFRCSACVLKDFIEYSMNVPSLDVNGVSAHGRLHLRENSSECSVASQLFKRMD